MASINDTGSDQKSTSAKNREIAVRACYGSLRHVGIAPLKTVAILQALGVPTSEIEPHFNEEFPQKVKKNAASQKNRTKR